MDSFGRFLFGQVPWLQPVIAWSVALLVVILILIIPSYLLFLPSVQHIRRELGSYIARLSGRLAAARDTRQWRLDTLADEMKGQSVLRRLNGANRGTVGSIVGECLKALRKTSNALEATMKRLSAATQKLTKLIGELSLITSGVAAIPELPAAAELHGDVGRVRAARARLTIGSVLLVGLIFVNTGMLSQIIRDLGFIPATLQFFRLPLYVVFALFLTLLEAGLGFLHASTKPGPDEPDKLRLWPYIAILLALMIATVEGFFYSQVAPSRDALVEIPLLGYQMKQANLFFLWGFALVMVLFGLGSTWYDALESVRRGHALGEVRRVMRAIKKEQKASGDRLEQMDAVFVKARALAEEAQNLLAADVEKAGDVRGQVTRLAEIVEGLRRDPPAWAQTTEHELSRADVHHLAGQAGLWLCLVLAGATVLMFTTHDALVFLLGGLPSALAWSIAAAHAIVFFGVGFLYRGGETVVRGEAGEREFVSAPILTRALSLTLLGLVAVAYIAVLVFVTLPQYERALWVFNLLLGAFLAAAAYQLAPLLNVLRLWLRRVANMVATVVEFLYSALARTLAVIASVLEQIFYFLSAPIFALRGRVTKPEGTPVRREVSEAESAVAVGNGRRTEGQAEAPAVPEEREEH